MKSDVLIVGCGVMGSACATFLLTRAPGRSVSVVEPDPTHAKAASPRASGGLRRLFSLPENIQMSIFFIDWFMHCAEHLTVDGEVPDLGWKQGGYPFIVPPDPAKIATLEQQHRRQASLGVKVELLDPSAIKSRFRRSR
jgi:glycine/D-amino acid oxidase-like deaminating enzyme